MMELEKLQQMYNDHDFTNYQKIVKVCEANGVEQCLCYGHEFLNNDCTIEKCYAASLQKRCSPSSCMELHNENPCVWCRYMESYCKYRNEYGECDNDEI